MKGNAQRRMQEGAIQREPHTEGAASRALYRKGCTKRFVQMRLHTGHYTRGLQKKECTKGLHEELHRRGCTRGLHKRGYTMRLHKGGYIEQVAKRGNRKGLHKKGACTRWAAQRAHFLSGPFLPLSLFSFSLASCSCLALASFASSSFARLPSSCKQKQASTPDRPLCCRGTIFIQFQIPRDF